MALVLNGAVTIFVICWALWLGAMLIYPRWWEAVVVCEHLILSRLGLLPGRWRLWLWHVETRWPLKCIIAVTLVLALIAQRRL
jgi:hypothetical protein